MYRTLPAYNALFGGAASETMVKQNSSAKMMRISSSCPPTDDMPAEDAVW
jgi:hypothetical protein